MTSSLRTSNRGTLAALRTALVEAGYTEEAVGPLQRQGRFLPSDAGAQPLGNDLDQRLQTLTRLLALGRATPAADAAGALAPISLAELEALGLLTVSGGEVITNYVLAPYGHLLLAGDSRRSGERDVVSSYTNPSAVSARLTPRETRDAMLDLGTGSGVLALLAAEHCQRVTAVDINPHALTVARFNAQLNEVDNARFLEGSWFEPVEAESFDLIISNPPYVVSPDAEFTYRDSGLLGTALLEQLCQDIPRHLRPDGLAIVLACWPHAGADDWATAPTSWVTDSSCDTLLIRYSSSESFDHAVNWNTSPVRFLEPDRMKETVARWLDYYEAIGAQVISFGALVLRRRPSGTRWVRALDANSPPGERAGDQLVRLVNGTDLDRASDDRALLAETFALPDGLDIRQRFQRREARFTGRPAMISLDQGLGVCAAVDPDALDVVFRFDGRLTLSEIVDRVADRRDESADSVARQAVEATRELLARGLLAA